MRALAAELLRWCEAGVPFACADRAARLRAAGVSEVEIARLRAPIGLDLGAVTPEETIVSIAAEIVAALRGGDGAPLSSTTGPIHRTVHRAPRTNAQTGLLRAMHA
jgi:xanthine dehydrogenase accessory factor